MKKRNDNVLADGELTGHAHRAEGRGVAVYGAGVQRLLNAPHGATVTHEEHHAIDLPAGEYEISRVQEYDYDTEESRNVAD
jgi:hypothetical protein